MLNSKTQKQILLHTLEDSPTWTPSWALIKTDTKYGWLGLGTLQNLRAMVKEGLVVKLQQGKYVTYKITQAGKEFLEDRQTQKFDQIKGCCVWAGKRWLTRF